MSELASNPVLSRFIKPTLDTPFWIDLEWWERQGLDFDVALLNHLCPEHRAAFSGQQLPKTIDWVDPQTGEVKPVPGLRHIIATHCSRQPGYVSSAPTMVEAIFRVFLQNNNRPLTVRELAAKTGYPPRQVLRVLAGRRVRKGIRPYTATR
jgi:hypothetical protein